MKDRLSQDQRSPESSSGPPRDSLRSSSTTATAIADLPGATSISVPIPSSDNNSSVAAKASITNPTSSNATTVGEQKQIAPSSSKSENDSQKRDEKTRDQTPEKSLKVATSNKEERKESSVTTTQSDRSMSSSNANNNAQSKLAVEKKTPTPLPNTEDPGNDRDSIDPPPQQSLLSQVMGQNHKAVSKEQDPPAVLVAGGGVHVKETQHQQGTSPTSPKETATPLASSQGNNSVPRSSLLAPSSVSADEKKEGNKVVAPSQAHVGTQRSHSEGIYTSKPTNTIFTPTSATATKAAAAEAAVPAPTGNQGSKASHAVASSSAPKAAPATSIPKKPPEESPSSTGPRPDSQLTTTATSQPIPPARTNLSSADSIVPTTSAGEDAFTKARKPLTDLYGPYVVPTDTNLQDARNRLKKALEQTLVLRKAFTERVYGKYRVCLRPPAPLLPEIVESLQQDPARHFQKVQEELLAVKEEKELEKKDAAKLNVEMSSGSKTSAAAVAASSLIDNGEQLVFLTSGLNLVILPEEEAVDPALLKGYTDRGPVHPVTGQRVKSISQAAATAGEVILDRARKAAAMRIERQRRLKLQLLSGEVAEDEVDGSSLTRLQALSTTGASVRATTAKGSADSTVAATGELFVSPRPSTGKGAVSSTKASLSATTKGLTSYPGTDSQSTKSVRSRVQSALSPNALLSLNPNAEEVRNEGKLSAATLALIAKGVGASAGHKTTQQRLRHPHPESQGGRRRAGMNPTKKDPPSSNRSVEQQQPFLQEYLALTLPPLPAAKERLDRKPFDIVATEEGSTERAQKSVRSILDQFKSDRNGNELGTVTRIRMMHGLFKLSLDHNDPARTSLTSSVDEGGTLDRERKPSAFLSGDDSFVDPLLTFSVLNAVGLADLAQPQLAPFDLPPFDPEVTAMWSDSLKELHSKLSGANETVTGQLFPEKDRRTLKRKLDCGESVEGNLTDSRLDATVVSAPVESIRGGGGVRDSSGAGGKSDGRGSGETKEGSRDTAPSNGDPRGHTTDANGRRRSASSPGRAAASYANSADQRRPHVPLHPDAAHLAFLGAAARASSLQAVAGNVPGYLTPPPERFHHNSTFSALHLANQLRHMHHSAAGDLAEYLGTLPHQTAQGYDLSSLLSGANASAMTAAQNSIAALGLARPHPGLVNFAFQDRAAAARAALIVREQHAAALQTSAAGFAQLTTGPYSHVSPHPVAVSAFLGTPAPPTLHNQSHIPVQVSAPAQIAMNGTPLNAAADTQHNTASMQSTSQNLMSSQSNQAGGSLQTNFGLPDMKSSPFSNQKPQHNSRTDSLSISSPATNQQINVDPVTANQQPAVDSLKAALKASHQVSVDPSTESRHTTVHSLGANQQTSQQIADQEERKIKLPETTEPSKEETRSQAPHDGNLSEDSSKRKTDVKPMNESESKPPIKVSTSMSSEDQTKPTSQDTDGMRFFLPDKPAALSAEAAALIRSGRFAEAAPRFSEAAAAAATEYLVQVGAAVPIPRALVLGPLKEKLNTPGFKSTGNNGGPLVPRDVVAASIQVWLWATNEDCFQRAFEKSGRTDVDPDCRWLIQAAVDVSVRELSLDIAESMARGEGPFAEASAARKSNVSNKGPAIEADKNMTSKKIEVHTAKVVSSALMAAFRIDRGANFSLAQFDSLIDYLDEARLGVLRAKSQERVLLASLISRKTNMSESFAQAYVSAMVRAGEALGHGRLFELAQDERVKASTMIPYDILTDEHDAWEDPCKPDEGFTVGLTGDELFRRAHARAVIVKSLRKLQDKHNVRGGTPGYGPYADQGAPDSASKSSLPESSQRQAAPVQHNRPGPKRKYSLISEPPMPPGTGSAEALSWMVYDPRHFSEPLAWDSESLENMPYGRHNAAERPRAMSVSTGVRSGEPRSTKKAKKVLGPPHNQVALTEKVESPGKLPRSTCEIPWTDIAEVFQLVTLQKKSTPSKPPTDNKKASAEKRIFAPYCKQLVSELNSEDESEEEEDLCEATTLARHQIVLDAMKAKLTAYMQARRKQQDKRKSKQR